MTDFELQKDLRKHHVYTSWQFIQYTRKNIEVVEYCAKILELLVAKMENKTVRWEQNIFNDLIEQITPDGKKILTKSVTVDDMPDYDIRVVGEKVDSWFLFDKLVRDFYQYSMNAFDSISQIANAGLLANRSKAYDSTDFQRMCGTFSQMTYSNEFPLTANWFAKVYASAQYKYIEAVNNRTKHTGDIANKLAMGLLGSDSNTKIGPFFRKSAQHETKELSDQLWATIDFVKDSWETFMDAFEKEYVLDVFVDGRFEGIDGVYQ